MGADTVRSRGTSPWRMSLSQEENGPRARQGGRAQRLRKALRQLLWGRRRQQKRERTGTQRQANALR